MSDREQQARTGRPVQSSASRLTRHLLVAAGLVLSAGCVWVALGAQEGEKTEKTADPGSDRLQFGGEEVVGRLLDITDATVVIETAAGKRLLDAGRVSGIERDIDEAALTKYEKFWKKFDAEGDGKKWKNLARFARKNGLWPEYRKALRRLLEFEPDNAGAHKGLGKALLDGKWLTEAEVEEKKLEGYVIAAGKLEKRKRTAVADDKDLPKNIRILERVELSDKERKSLERKRKEEAEIAEKFRKKVEKERRARAEWNEYRTDNFLIQCNSTAELTQRYGVIMELIRGKLAKMFRSKIRRKQRAPVKIYANQEAFMSDDMFGRWGGRGLGGYYMPHNQMIVTYHGTFGFTGTTFGVLAHEGTHYFQGLVLQDFDNLPIWLVEGLAVYFGDGSRFDPSAKKGRRIRTGLIPRDRLTHLQEKMLKKRHTKVSKLISLTRRNGFSGSHYADAWGVIYFLVNSGSDGEKFLQKYWGVGLNKRIQKQHFTELAEKYFGSMEELEKRYVKYILSLDPPPAGRIVGEYFVSDDFQLEFAAPGTRWKFFEDKDDKKLLVGLLEPSTTGRIKIYYENNMEGLEPDDFIDAWKQRWDYSYEDIDVDKHEIAGLPGYKATYIDTGREENFGVSIRMVNGRVVVEKEDEDDDEDDDDDDDEDDEEPEKPQPRRCVRYLLVQKDGVASIECSAEEADFAQHAELFDEVWANLRLISSRRW